jgi:hypothetical protein
VSIIILYSVKDNFARLFAFKRENKINLYSDTLEREKIKYCQLPEMCYYLFINKAYGIIDVISVDSVV